MSFANLGLSADLVRAVAEHGYTIPTPIQTQAIPAVLGGGDLLAGAQTGTGKTAGFVLPILQLLSTRPGATTASGRKPVRVLILAPTRELAAQIEESVRVYGKYSKRSSTVVFGGVGINPQMIKLKRGVDILVATPGRLLDLQQQRAVDLSHVEILVLDEADRMLDMGFWPDVQRILSALPKERQTLLFSATMPGEVLKLTQEFLRDPQFVQVGRRGGPATTITHSVQTVPANEKTQWLAKWLREEATGPVLVFCRTKIGAEKLATRLSGMGIRTAALHADRTQQQRMSAVEGFRTGTYPVLVATDVAARGLDIDGIAHVVNFEVPDTPEAYVHRVGRTGRSDASGSALTLVAPEELRALRALEKAVGVQLQ